jgi:hypothetical protein
MLGPHHQIPQVRSGGNLHPQVFGAVFDFLGHPSCLYVVDPEFKTIEMICELVKKAGDKAAIVDLDTIARSVKKK